MILKQICRKMFGVSSKTIVLSIIFSLILYNEWMVYKINSLSWTKMECADDDVTCAKVLFVADPQIQGLQFTSYPLNELFIWDSDRYLQSTFREVISHFKPDVIVYLGDLTDEGSISSVDVFLNYTERLFDIFNVDYPVQTLWLAGDNDVGGENEAVRRDIYQTFLHVFKSVDFMQFKNITFLPISGIIHTIPDTRHKDLSNQLRIVVSHFPVWNIRINSMFFPHIYFCAHKHEAKYIRHFFMEDGKDDTSSMVVDEQEDMLMMEFKTTNKTFSQYEIFVPTCSYRMGTSNIGYGAAVINNKYHYRVQYTVFWTPRRFIYLFLYLIVIIVLCLYYTGKQIFAIAMNNRYLKSYDRLNKHCP